MEKEIKIIAFHLPQFHSIPENDEWWGAGFTEWTNVKSATKYYQNQRQPRVPLNSNYYNLLEEKNLIWQSSLARDYGIYGFCFYHYWFNGHLLLEKPVEKYLQLSSKDKIHYCICWANENWTRAWADKKDEVLISQKYGTEKEWEEHFMYFLPFFKDEKYILEEGKPLLVIYRPELVQDLGKMIKCWENLAIKNGFKGISLLYQQYKYSTMNDKNELYFDHNIEYQPAYAINQLYKKNSNSLLKRLYDRAFFLRKPLRFFSTFFRKNKKFVEYDYDVVWKHILTSSPSTKKAIPCAFVDFDNSPRRKDRCVFFKGVTPEKFGYYFSELVRKTKEEYSTNCIFIFAWNEWGESAYLEPDDEYGYRFLEEIKNAIKKSKANDANGVGTD